jgi:SAM-dependent methyltransferase
MTMDLRDRQSGAGEDFFWFEGKNGLVEALLRRCGAKAGARILDVGAGTGGYLPAAKRLGDVYVVDADPSVLELVPEGAYKEKRCADLRSLPYPDGFFDIIMAYDILEHVDDDARAVSEVHRCLKPGGAFIFTVPAHQGLFSYHDRVLGHLRRYGMPDVKAKMACFGSSQTGYWLAALFPAMAAMRILQRRKKSGRHLARLPGPLNRLLTLELRLENRLIGAGFRLPFGLTIYGICRKAPL